jgi:hypothetical protein
VTNVKPMVVENDVFNLVVKKVLRVMLINVRHMVVDIVVLNRVVLIVRRVSLANA